MKPSTSLGTTSNVGMENPSPSVRQTGNMRCLLVICGVCRSSVSRECQVVNSRRRCRVNGQRIYRIPAVYVYLICRGRQRDSSSRNYKSTLSDVAHWCASHINMYRASCRYAKTNPITPKHSKHRAAFDV